MIKNSTYNSMLYRNCGNTRKWRVMGGSVEKWRKEKNMGRKEKRESNVLPITPKKTFIIARIFDKDAC